jgi:hypothetical protein
MTVGTSSQHAQEAVTVAKDSHVKTRSAWTSVYLSQSPPLHPLLHPLLPRHQPPMCHHPVQHTIASPVKMALTRLPAPLDWLSTSFMQPTAEQQMGYMGPVCAPTLLFVTQTAVLATVSLSSQASATERIHALFLPVTDSLEIHVRELINISRFPTNAKKLELLSSPPSRAPRPAKTAL